MRVCWQGIVFSCFSNDNGVKQGGFLSTFLFRFYIRDLIRKINISTVGCSMFNKCFNLLAYAVDLVLLAPSWCSLQFLINLLVAEADAVGLSVNAKKTVTVIFNPYDKRKCIRTNVPQFSLHSSYLTYVTSFKYLGHIMHCTMKMTLIENGNVFTQELTC